VVEIPDDDFPPPGWDQWASLPTSAPEPQAGALVRRWDGRMMAGCLGHSGEASSLRAGLPASGGHAASLERGRQRVDTPPPILPRLMQSRSCGRSSVIMTPRSTGC
jgi:hypothetical protein